MNQTEEPIIVEQTFDASLEEVWEALTVTEKMHQWYFDNIPSFKAEVGFQTRFDVHNEGRVFPHIWTVTEVVPMKSLSYDWRVEGYKGDTFACFELWPEENLTRVKLTHTVRESFPPDIPEFERESGVAGWNYLIRECLKEFLECKS